MDIFLQYLVNGIIKGSLYVLPAIGVSLLYGMLRIVNFAQGEIYMLGAVTAYIVVVNLKLSYFMGFITAVVVMALFGLVFERLVVRPLLKQNMLSIVIATLSASMILQNGAQRFWSADPKILPSPFIGPIIEIGLVRFSSQQLLMLTVSLLLTILATFFVTHSRVGWAIKAVSQDWDAASLMGIKTNRVVALTFSIGFALAAVGGVLIGPNVLIDSSMGRATGQKVIAAVVLGGTGSIPGAFIGGLTLGVVEALVSGYISTKAKDAVAFVVLIAVMLIKPTGLFGKQYNDKF